MVYEVSSITKKHDNRTTVLRNYFEQFNYDDISYPTTYDDTNKFQEHNKICIYVYVIDENSDIVCDFAGKTQYIQNDLIY